MLKLLLVAAILLAAAGGAAYWTLARDDDSAEADVQVVRWGNVTVAVSSDSGVTAAPGSALSGERQSVLVLKKGDSFIDLDAQTGAIVQEKVADSDRPAIQAVLASLQVSELDEAKSAWPYGSGAPALPRERFGAVTYTPPDPASGIVVSTGIADTFTDQGSFPFIQVANVGSSLFLNAQSGLVDGPSTLIATEDEEAFKRFLSEVEYLGPSP